MTVLGTANIFGAGHATAPAPGGGGGGTLPPSFSFTAGADQILTFSSVTGGVYCNPGSPTNGPDGGPWCGGNTNISSYGGISGIIDNQASMFMVGVFLNDTEPQDPAPSVLDFSPGQIGAGFQTLAPQLNQTFFIGDGLTGTGAGTVQQFQVPTGATRLFLGFADGCNNIQGPPGCYDDNGGQLSAAFQIGQLLQGPTGSERLGDSNPSVLGFCRSCAGDPIDTFSGNFTHTFSELAIPGRGPSLRFTLTYNALAAEQSGPLGFGWTGIYNAALAINATAGTYTVVQENGSTVTFSSNGSGGYIAPAQVLATLVLNGDGGYTFTRLQDQTHIIFSASGQLTSATDRNGYTTSFSHNGSGQLTTVTDPAGRSLSFSYDGSGHLTQVTDPIGRSVSFLYDGNGNLASITDVGGGVATFTYDVSHLLLTLTDPRGGKTTNVYDSSHRVTSQTDPLGRTTSFSYTPPDSNGNSSTTITDPKGNVTVDQYSNAVLVAKTQGYGTAQAAIWSYTYDPATLGLASVTDPNGHTSTKTWDASGNVLSATDALGRTATYTYNSFNEVTAATDPLGVTTTFTYDNHGNLLSVATPLVGANQTQTTSYTYGDASHPGDVTAMTDPDGKTWHTTYDANGDRASVTDPLGDKTTYQYNAIGWMAAQVSPNSNTTSYVRNAFGDVTQATDPLGHTTANVYDADRNLTQTTDADGHITQYTYDLDNEPTQVTRADGSTLKSGYDADGNVTSQTDGLGHTTAYSYDPLNRLVSTTDPLNRTTTYGYDAAGNRTSLTDPASQVTSYLYDAANELVGISYSDGHTPAVTYTYDADGQRLSMVDGTGTTRYVYDSLHRLIQSADGAGQTVSYTYDLKGQLTSLSYPNGKVVTRTFDAAGRLTGVKDWLGNTTTFGYDADSNLVRESYPTGAQISRSYDHDDRLLVIRAHFPNPSGPSAGLGPIGTAGFTYTRDNLGLLATFTPDGLSQTTETYSYTTLNQLSAVNGTAYAYDHGDNLTQMGGATLSYNAANELTSFMPTGGTTTSYSYDSRGNRTQAVTGSASTSYSYDQANRLVGYVADVSLRAILHHKLTAKVHHVITAKVHRLVGCLCGLSGHVGAAMTW